MNMRRIRPVRLVQPADGEMFASSGRPDEERAPIRWVALLLRLLTIAWAAAIAVALLDEFGLVGHLPFLMAMGMTGLLVASGFLLTREDPEPDDGRAAISQDDDGERDLLTELPTFKQFSKRLGDEFSRTRKSGRSCAVVLIDVNNLSAVNKEYGVRAGDEVLRHVAKAIDGTRRYNDLVARLGDDEFGVILMDTAEDGVRAFIDRLEDRLSRESAVADVNGRSISLWAGICTGSALSSPAITSAEGVLEAAMADLNHAKQERERRRRMWLSA